MDAPAHTPERDQLAAALAAFVGDVERLDLVALAARLAEDVELRLGNAPPLVGRGPAVAALGGRWAGIERVGYERLEVVIAPPRAVLMSRVTYAIAGGRQVSVREATHFRWTADRRIDRLWVYEDPAELVAAGLQRP